MKKKEKESPLRPIGQTLLVTSGGVSDCRVVFFICSPFCLCVFLGSVLVAVTAAPPCLLIVILRYEFPFFTILLGFILMAAAIAIGAPAVASSARRCLPY